MPSKDKRIRKLSFSRQICSRIEIGGLESLYFVQDQRNIRSSHFLFKRNWWS